MNHIEKLVDGFKRFRSHNYEENSALFDRLAKQGQSPKTIVVGCCDSRVDPAIVTDCDPGDLFIIRNVANLVPPFETSGNYHGTSAALEFGVRHLLALCAGDAAGGPVCRVAAAAQAGAGEAGTAGGGAGVDIALSRQPTPAAFADASRGRCLCPQALRCTAPTRWRPL